jgi:hypothetical protein
MLRAYLALATGGNVVLRLHVVSGQREAGQTWPQDFYRSALTSWYAPRSKLS